VHSQEREDVYELGVLAEGLLCATRYPALEVAVRSEDRSLVSTGEYLFTSFYD
jgi:hypothetical protein